MARKKEEKRADEPIESLRNLGPTSGRWLRQAGIETVGQLAEIGAVDAFAMVRQQYPEVSLNLLWAMAAGLDDTDWRKITANSKEHLLGELAKA